MFKWFWTIFSLGAPVKPDVKDLPWEITARSCYFKHYRGILVTSLLSNVDSGSGLCRRTYQDASITKKSKDKSLKLRAILKFYCLSLLHKCLTIRGIECNFSINDCLLTPLIVLLYANCLIECLFFTYDCQKVFKIFFWCYWLSIARV